MRHFLRAEKTIILLEENKIARRNHVRKKAEPNGNTRNDPAPPERTEWTANRQPFPGPDLAVRVIDEITRAKLDILREADAIFRNELESAGVRASQYFAVLTNLRSVGVMGDGRTYDYTIALRAVLTSDFMTCEYAPIPHELLSKISRRITNEVKGVNRIVYDITDKLPATIEWE